MSEQLTGPQDAPEGVRATSVEPDAGADRSFGRVPAAAFSDAPVAPPRQSQGRTETYTVTGPDGKPVPITRDLDTGEQTTTYANGSTNTLGALDDVPANVGPMRGGRAL